MFCRQCGSRVEEGLRFCPSCGAALAAGAGPQAGGQPPAGGEKPGLQRWAIVLIAVVAVLVPAGAAAGIYFGVKGSPGGSRPPTSSETKPDGGSKPAISNGEASEKIAYLNNMDIYVVDLDGSGRRKLTDRGDIIDFDVSPDGAMMAFVARVGEQQIIFKMNADGTDVSQVTLPEKGVAENPAFDPGGRYIYFTRITPEEQADIEAGRPFATRFERYGIASNSVDHIYTLGGMQEQSVAGLFPDPDGGALFFNRYGSDYPSAVPYKLTLGANPIATEYMPMVTDTAEYWALAYELTGFSVDGAYISYFKQALFKETDPDTPARMQVSACYRSRATGKETSVASYDQGESMVGGITGMRFSSVDERRYYYAKASGEGPGGELTLDFYEGTTGGADSRTGLSISIANGQESVIVWHPLAVER